MEFKSFYEAGVLDFEMFSNLHPFPAENYISGSHTG
jgi:hypothetical protein